MATQSTTTIDFGAAPGTNIITKVVAANPIATTQYVEAFIMNVASGDHNAYEHSMVPVTLRCGNIVTNTSFDIVASTDMRLTGIWNVYYVFN